MEARRARDWSGTSADPRGPDVVARFILVFRPPEIAAPLVAPRNDRLGACLAVSIGEAARDDKAKRSSRFIFVGFDIGASSVLNDLIGSLGADLCSGYFRVPRAFRIMPVKMLNIPAMTSRAVSRAWPIAAAPVVAAL
jgi:hypothetical protein